VSSHLITEMSLTAERLVVIGRGSLISETSVAEFTAQSAGEATVRLVTPTPRIFLSALRDVGAKVKAESYGTLMVSGMSSVEIGDLAALRSLTVHELTPVRASLEDAFMELTSDAVEFRPTEAHDVALSAASGPDQKEAR